MREPILSLTDSPETPSLFLSHSAIIWRKPGEGRGGEGVEKEPLEFPSESPQRKKDLINPIGKAREERFDFSSPPPPPPPLPLYRVNTKDVLENVFHLASLYLTLLSLPLFSSSPAYLSLTLQLLLSFQFPSNFLTANNFSLRFSLRFILYFSTLCVFFSSPFSFRSGCKVHFLHYRVYTRR